MTVDHQCEESIAAFGLIRHRRRGYRDHHAVERAERIVGAVDGGGRLGPVVRVDARAAKTKPGGTKPEGAEPGGTEAGRGEGKLSPPNALKALD